MPSGSIPPNPSELLMTKETEELFAEVKKRFDYVIVDCPPIIVTDSSIVGKYVDLTLYVSRIGHTEKKKLKLPITCILKEKFPKNEFGGKWFLIQKNMTIIIVIITISMVIMKMQKRENLFGKRWFKL